MIWFLLAFGISLPLMRLHITNKTIKCKTAIIFAICITLIAGTIGDLIAGSFICSKTVIGYEAPENLYEKVDCKEIEGLKDNYEIHGNGLRMNEQLYYVFMLDGKVEKREASSTLVKETDNKKAYLCTYTVDTTIKCRKSRFWWLIQWEPAYKDKKQVLEVPKGTIEKIQRIDLE